ncbi:MAG: UPF0104 family protein [Gammaproteobacteria bacterium]|nr:UPF0104 family protein [Gammaproteobacteria bacterium]
MVAFPVGSKISERRARVTLSAGNVRSSLISSIPKPLRLAVTVGLFLALVAAVQFTVGWPALLRPWAEAPVAGLLLALALTFLSYGLRAIRLYAYFRTEIGTGWPLSLRLMLQHNLYNNLLPMRTGEISFPVLMARYFAIPLGRSLPALLWFRLLDLHTLALLVLIALPLPWGRTTSLIVALLVLPLPWIMLQVTHVLRRRPREDDEPRWRAWLQHLLEGLPQGPALFWSSWFWTAVNWIVKMLVFAWVLGRFVEVPLAGALMGAITGDLTSILPVNGLAGAGTYEAGVIAGLLPYGIDAKVGLTAAVNLHLFMLAATLLGGAASLIVGKVPERG